MTKIQYTIRNIPPSVDKVIRKLSNHSGKSLNQTIVDLLSLQSFGTTEPPAYGDFDWLFNQNSLGASFDESTENLSRVDGKLWK